MSAPKRGVKVRTGQGMVALTGEEAAELLARLKGDSAGRAAGQSMAVSANASTSVTFTAVEKAAVFEVLARWQEDRAESSAGEGLLNLKLALARDLGFE